MPLDVQSMLLKDAWSGGQYSLVRALAAGTLAVAGTWSIFAAGTIDPVSALPSLAAVAVALGIGRGGRVLAALLAVAVSFGDWELLGPAARQFAAAWLSLHLLLPPAPYGSIAARGRIDPRGIWSMPGWYPSCCVALFVFSRLFSGVHAMFDGNEILAGAFFFVGLLALSPKTGLAGWALSFGLGLALAAQGHGSFSAAWFLHVIAFQPAWAARREEGAPAHVFYDGTCALCHGAIRFLLAEDSDPPRFRLAPLDSNAFRARVTEFERTRMPDSVIVARERELLSRSAAAIAILDALGGWWWLVAGALRVVPTSLADAAYDAIARRRYRWFGRRSEACPVMPAALRGRIDA